MLGKLIGAALGLVAISWWMGIDPRELKESFVETAEGTGSTLAGGASDWHS